MAERSGWTHAICTTCYDALEPGRRPALVVEAPPTACCRCDEIADPPVYYRADPAAMRCGGVHDAPDDDADDEGNGGPEEDDDG